MTKWTGFWIVSLIWGSSYLLISIGVEQLSPFQVAFIRTTIAAIGLNAVLMAQGKRLPLRWHALVPLIVIGIGNTAIPYGLIGWAEQRVESGLASVLQATTPIFGLIIAHYAFADERITVRKIIGVLVSFFGVVVLASRAWQDGSIEVGSLLGIGAMTLSSFLYAAFTVYSRKTIQKQIEPIVIAAGSMTVGALVCGLMMIVTPLLGGQPPTPLDQVGLDALGAVLTLGVVNTFFAYLIFYSMVRDLGASRSQMVTYVVPVVGLTLGALFGETVDWRLLVGAALIFGGIGISTLRSLPVLRPRSAI